MRRATGEERVVVLGDWPQPAGVPEPRLRADDTSVSLLYRSAGNAFVVVRFPLCHYLTFGAPNDEALAGHPLFGRGLQHYSVHEVLASSLIRELERRNSVHPRHDPEWYLRGMRHYVFTFQDCTLECVAAANAVWAPSVALFETEEEAERSWRSSSGA
jgi:hypothetical protein